MTGLAARLTAAERAAAKRHPGPDWRTLPVLTLVVHGELTAEQQAQLDAAHATFRQAGVPRNAPVAIIINRGPLKQPPEGEEEGAGDTPPELAPGANRVTLRGDLT